MRIVADLIEANAFQGSRALSEQRVRPAEVRYRVRMYQIILRRNYPNQDPDGVYATKARILVATETGETLEEIEKLQDKSEDRRRDKVRQVIADVHTALIK